MQMWHIAAAQGFKGWAVLLALLTGLILGAVGVGDECGRGTVSFLLTRPRRRSRFVWTGFGVAVLEIAILLGSAQFAAFGTISYLSGTIYNWRFAAGVLLFLTATIVICAQTYAMSVVLRSARDGLNFSLALFVLELFVPEIVRYFYRINVPSILDLITDDRWISGEPVHFPLIRLLGWMAVAAVFLLIAQWSFARVEV